jgi:hypothetical protein
MLIKLHIFMLNEGNLHSTRYSQFSLVDVKTFIVCDFIFLSKEKIDIDWIEYKKPTKNRYWDMNCTINMFDFILYSIILYLILSYICIKAQKCGVLDMRKHFVQIILVKCNQQCKKKKTVKTTTCYTTFQNHKMVRGTNSWMMFTKRFMFSLR